MRKINLAFTHVHDHRDIKRWSGIIYHLAAALERQPLHVEYIEHLQKRRLYLGKALRHLYNLAVPGAYFHVERTTNMARMMADEITQRLNGSQADVVFSPGSIPIALLNTDRPKVFYTDATFAGILDQYPELRKYPTEYIQQGHDLERAAVRSSDLLIYSSQWAARTAMEFYGADEKRIRVIPFGSNLPEPDAHSIIHSVEARPMDRCTLLFIGVHWDRKGGEMAMVIADQLNRAGLPTELVICGCRPSKGPLPPYVRVIPFLDKQNATRLSQLDALISSSHFLVLPSIADCTPIVVSECSSRGLPCLTSDVGGLPEVVRHDRNGRTFPLDQGAAPYVAYILDLMGDEHRYRALAASCMQEYRERLNWNTCATHIRQEIEVLVGAQRSTMTP